LGVIAADRGGALHVVVKVLIAQNIAGRVEEVHEGLAGQV